MLYINQGFPSRHNQIYINSIKRKFEAKAQKIVQRRTKTSPERSLFYSDKDKLLQKYQTIDISQHLQEQSTANENHLPPIGNNHSLNQSRKRWKQIQREQYNSIRQQIAQKKQKSISTNPHHIKSLLQNVSKKDKHASSLIDCNYIRQSHRKKQKLLAQESWMDHLKNLNQNRKQSFLKNNSGYLFPELFSKLPKICASYQEQNLALARSMELKRLQQDIFCSRQSKRSQLKLRAQKLGELALKKRKYKTINYQNIDSQIAPWLYPNTKVRPII